jgi:Xaa-Pro aminopeptidase
MDLQAIQAALRADGIDGWLFFDFHHRDLLAHRILGLDPTKKTSRRWFYLVPAQGDPVKLAHRVEPSKLDSLPGRTEHYGAWKELRGKLRGILSGVSRVAMQYSPMCDIPYVSVVDAGTVELVESCGPKVVSSKDLVQQFEAVLSPDELESHFYAGERVQLVKDEAFALMDRALRDGKKITEHEVARFIVNRFEEEGLTPDGDTPIVGFNDHPANPHYEPTEKGSYALSRGDTILVDLWARRREPAGVYYDVTWCGFAGDDPPARYVEIFQTVTRARDAAVEFVRRRLAEGQTCFGYEVDDACRQVVIDAGYGDAFVHRTGHSIGLEVHGNGANIDNLETRDDRKIVPGVCFSVEPGIYLDGEMAVRSEIDVYVTHEGKAEVYGPIQQELIRIG